MAQVTLAQYEKALTRAHEQHLEITLLEPTLAHVYNPANGDGYYTVRFPEGAHVMSCNCQAGQAGTYCKHRALVREARVALAEDRRVAADKAAKAEATQATLDDLGWLGMSANQRAAWTLAHM